MKSASVEAAKSPFSAKLFSFLRELRNNNDREWFAENKSRYEQDVLFAAVDFVKQMQPRLAKHSRYLLAEPKRVGGSIMRIYRDTRFDQIMNAFDDAKPLMKFLCDALQQPY